MPPCRPIDALREALIDVAKRARVVCYGEIDRIVGLDVTRKPRDRGTLGRLLVVLGCEEVEAGRPFLPAVVVRKDSGRPGAGFYEAVRDLCPAHRAAQSNRQLHENVLREVQEFWADPDPGTTG